MDDGRSFVRGSRDRYDIIQASLVDTWAATAAGAYTLTENTLYTVEAFNDYIDHLTDDGVADDDAVGARRPASRVARAGSRRRRAAGTSPSISPIVQYDRVQTFMLKKSEFTPAEIATLCARRPGSSSST